MSVPTTSMLGYSSAKSLYVGQHACNRCAVGVCVGFVTTTHIAQVPANNNRGYGLVDGRVCWDKIKGFSYRFLFQCRVLSETQIKTLYATSSQAPELGSATYLNLVNVQGREEKLPVKKERKHVVASWPRQSSALKMKE